MDFSAALGYLRDGQLVARAGWNGKGMWLGLVTADNWGLAKGHPFDPLAPGAKVLPWIGMKTSDGGFVPWLASQTDLLAEDWSVLPLPLRDNLPTS